MPHLGVVYNYKPYKSTNLSTHNFVYSQEKTWPTPSGITKDRAETICLSYIEVRPVAQKCRALPDSKFELILESCIEDILVRFC